jgi:hypothetical protein
MLYGRRLKEHQEYLGWIHRRRWFVRIRRDATELPQASDGVTSMTCGRKDFKNATQFVSEAF